MRVFYWNCRGACHKDFLPAVREYIRTSNPDVLFIVEPRVSGRRADRICRRFRAFSSERIEAEGFAGGIWMLWRSDRIQVVILDRNPQAMHCQVRQGLLCWTLTAIYARPLPTRRKELWRYLRDKAEAISEPWVVLGDFNDILDPSEKQGGAPFDPRSSMEFQEALDTAGLCDLGSSRPRFTWWGGRSHNYDRLMKRLDRATSNADWRLAFPNGGVRVLPRLKSDHHPIFLDTMEQPRGRNGARPFRYLAAWQGHPDFPRLLSQTWNNHMGLSYCLGKFSVEVRKWNREVFGFIQAKKNRTMARLGGIQRAVQVSPNNFLFRLEHRLS